ncbi:MAG: hypothetical protein U1A78_24585 [Polyangia bacterium]
MPLRPSVLRAVSTSLLAGSLGLLALSTGGCHGAARRPDGALGGRPIGSSVEAAMREVGRGAPLVLVLRPSRWADSAATRDSLAELLGGVERELMPPSLRGVLPGALRAASLRAALGPLVRALLPAALPSAASFTERLTAWDDSRPVVAALYEPSLQEMGEVGEALLAQTGPAATATATAASPAPAAAPAAEPLLRHRVLVPARDSAALIRQLQVACNELGLQVVSEPVPGGVACGFPAGILGLFAGADHVRIEILYSPIERERQRQQAEAATAQEELPDWLRKPGEPPRPAPPPPPPPSFSDSPSRLLAALRLPPPSLAGEPAQAATPALHQVTRGDDLAAVYLRPARLRSLALTRGAQVVGGALLAVDGSMKAVLLAKAWAEIASGYLMMSPEGAQTEDLALLLSRELHVGGVASLTAAGAAAWGAGKASALPPLAPTASEPPLFLFRLGLDLQTLLQRTPVPPALTGLTLRELADRVRECGSLCFVYASVAMPLAWGRHVLSDPQLARGLPINLLGTLPSAVTLSLTGFVRGPGGTTLPQGALALAYPKDQPTSWLTLLTAPILSRLGAQAAPRPTPQGESFEIGFSGPPPQFLKPEPPPLGDGVLAEGRFDLERLQAAPFFRELAPKAPWLSRLAAVRGQARLTGGALLVEYALDLRGGALRPFVLPAAGAPSWAPAPPPPPSRERGCLGDAITGLRRTLDALAGVDPSMQQTLLARGLADAKVPLACAAAAPALRPETERLLRFVEQLGRVLRATQPAPPRRTAPTSGSAATSGTTTAPGTASRSG